VALFLVVFHFAVPFSLLLSRDLKRMPHRLIWVALALLLVRYIDLVMLVSPEFDATGVNVHMMAGEHEAGFYVHWLDLAAPLAVGGLWLGMFFTQLAQRPLLAFRDPYLHESLETTGGH
jgi:threonine/homoserine efflux transporter RhtA